MSLTASLPMYDLPGTSAAWDRLWDCLRVELRAAGFDAPDALRRDTDLQAMWRDPNLLLSQTCSLPWRNGVKEWTKLVGAFDFGLPGCPPGTYHSTLIGRQDDNRSLEELLVQGRPAINAPDSQSGCRVLEHLGVNPAAALMTGSHAASLRAVERGEADFAALDSQTFRLLENHALKPAAIRILRHSRATPGLPLITARARDADTIFSAVELGVSNAPDDVRRELGICGVVPVEEVAYVDASRF